MDVRPPVTEPSGDRDVEANVEQKADLRATPVHSLNRATELMGQVKAVGVRAAHRYTSTYPDSGGQLGIHLRPLIFH